MAPALLMLSILGYLTYKDYSAFLELGPGGTPSTFCGYMKITFLRIFFALGDPLCPSPIPAELENTGFLRAGAISPRQDRRPDVRGIAPHRQINQIPPQDVFNYLSTSIMKLAKDYPSKFRISTSAFEKHCPGLFSLKKANPAGNGEVCHAHPSDGSLHMTLHPEDIKTVLEAGWGERHPLSRGGWCSRFVPQQFVMIYAPRSKEEVETVMEIIKASVGWISGETFVPNPSEEAQNIMPFIAPEQPHDCMDQRCGAVAS
ncbi:hypothetical protein BDD12DRAFT_738370 [Trichophaea hybrida]|nr:hypothetical protein BDD12DRAFT_738370 [Trichophaea hybrida]